MAARKLATEIDKTLKKVAEGVEIFESIFDKIQVSTNQTQKEKLEADLKSQIKKLQRLRDQIKTWMQSNDIKDKQPLMDNRKLIETQMERFKACEKEMKTKAFSKEGLSAAIKLDPKEQEKADLVGWIQGQVETLEQQVEQTEAEVEQLQLHKKKKDSDKSQRLDELETLNERRSWHIARLEIILRLLENGQLGVDSVMAAKEDIAYFVESNTEEDFDEDEGIYDELNLHEEDLFGNGADDIQSSHDSQSVADDISSPASLPPMPNPPAPHPPTPKTPAKEKPAIPEAERSPTTSKPKTGPSPTARKATLESNTRPVLSTPTRSVSGPAPVPTPRAVPTTLPPFRYAAAAAAANASPAAPPTPTSASAPPPPTAQPSSAGPPGFAHPSTSVSSNSDSRQASTASSPEVSKAIPPELSSSAASAAPSPMMAPSGVPNFAQGSPALSAASVNGAYSIGHSSSPSGAPSVSSQSQAFAPSPTPSSLPLPLTDASASSDRASSPKPLGSGMSERSAAEPRLPSSLADLVTSFESAKQKSMKRDNDLGTVHKILDAGFSNVPQPLDAEKPKYYVPRNPFATPAYYPHEPSGQFANPALFSKFDVDTLFYIFYYCQGTYLQYLAASELKKQSWRFHKQYLTWFQRANEPQQITDEYEQGVYLYFDWEGSWCQRRKSDFRFEYKYLSSD